jgi:LemA protein
MSTGHVVGALAAACAVFWLVGAYNRLIRLRGAIVRQFVPVHEQFLQRHALLERLALALSAVLANAAPRLDALRAALGQVHTACVRAKARPVRAEAINSLRIAEGILSEARAHLPVQSAPGTELTELNTQLLASDAALGFARQQFNATVTQYNRAIRQFPTLLLVGLFGFRTAATL